MTHGLMSTGLSTSTFCLFDIKCVSHGPLIAMISDGLPHPRRWFSLSPSWFYGVLTIWFPSPNTTSPTAAISQTQDRIQFCCTKKCEWLVSIGFIHTYIHTLHYITLHYIALHCIALHCIALHYITYIHTYIPYHTIPYHTIPYHTIRYHTIPYHTIPYHTILPCIHTKHNQHTIHYITCHYITLHCITLHCSTLHCSTLHYITLHYITLHYIHTYIHIYIYIHTYTCCENNLECWIQIDANVIVHALDGCEILPTSW